MDGVSEHPVTIKGIFDNRKSSKWIKYNSKWYCDLSTAILFSIVSLKQMKCLCGATRGHQNGLFKGLLKWNSKIWTLMHSRFGPFKYENCKMNQWQFNYIVLKISTRF